MTRRRLLLGTAGVGALLLLGVVVVRLAGPARPSMGRPPVAVSYPAAENAAGALSGAVATTELAQPVEDMKPSATPPRPPVPPELAGVFDESEGAVARTKAVDALGRGLSPDALAALRWLLRKPDEGEALRNNVANRLRECGEEHLADDLAQMLWDERETPEWRNYCVQHLYTCYEQAEEPDPTILDTLFKAASPKEADEKLVRICAVWSLARVATSRDKSRLPDEETLGRIRAAALEALREKDVHFLITTAGVQSCARLGLKETLPDIRRISGDDSTKPTHLRIVAVSALGDLGDASDLALLDRLAASATGQLKAAAELDARKLRSRPGGDASP